MRMSRKRATVTRKRPPAPPFLIDAPPRTSHARALACAIVPVLYALLLPALREVRWGGGQTFARKSAKWSISTLISTAPANGLFAASTSLVFAYALSSETANDRRVRPGLFLMSVGWLLLLAVPIDTVSNAAHYVAVGVGSGGALMLGLSVASQSRWPMLLSVVMAIVAVLFATGAAVTAAGSPFIFLIEVMALTCISFLLPLSDLIASRSLTVVLVKGSAASCSERPVRCHRSVADADWR